MSSPNLKSSSAQIDLLLEQAIALHKSGSFAKAKVMYEDILKVRPSHSDVLHLLGLVAFQTNAPRLAVELIDKSIRIDARKAEYHSNRGLALAALGESEAAIASYDEAIALKPDFAGAHSNRGLALTTLDQHKEAIANFDKAIETEPGYAIAYNNRGRVLALAKKPMPQLPTT